MQGKSTKELLVIVQLNKRVFNNYDHSNKLRRKIARRLRNLSTRRVLSIKFDHTTDFRIKL